MSKLTILLGPSHTGKSSALLDRLEQHMHRGERAVLLVPEQATYHWEQRLCARLGGLIGIEVYSFERLSQRLIGQYGRSLPYLSDQGRCMVLRRAAYRRQNDLSLFGKAAQRKGFASSILESLTFLELDHAVFQVELADAPEGPAGRDAVRFLFSSTGKAPQDLAKVASGGELSRIMLSLKAMMARYTAMPTLIFDEIDSGVSGSVADKMGQMICRMGEDMQVFAITHLPQVAAKGNAHYLVSKENDATSIRALSPEERVREIARMLSGSVVTEAAVANAEALLGTSLF